MYEELVKKIRHCATDPMHCLSCGEDKDGRCFKRLMTQAADAIEGLSKLADAIPHVCECCIGCEIESGGCDNAFVLSPKRVREYLSKSRWISVTERLPEAYKPVLLYNGEDIATGYMHSDKRFTVNGSHFPSRSTHWQPLSEPPKEK